MEIRSVGTWNVRSRNQGKLEVVKQEMTRVNVDILGISVLKWIGGTFIQARRSDRQPNDQAECKRGQGGFIFKGRFVEAIRETLVRWDVLGIL